jgi:glycosyltransferase involved in cell wall biosynthesis/GT2 family glycosyltransferase
MASNPAPEAVRAALAAVLEVRSLDRGGMETVVALLARGLPAFGIQPVVVCTEAGGRGVDELRRAGVRVEVLFGDDRAGQMAVLLDRLEVGVVNAHYSTLGARIAAERGVPVVVTLHNSYAWFGPGAFDEIGGIDPYVSGYVAVSQSAADFTTRRFHVAAERIRVVRNGIAPRAAAVQLGADERAALLAELDLPVDAQIVVQVGRIERVKGQLALVDAMARLAGDHPSLYALVLGADGETQYARTARTRVEEHGLLGRVRFLGERDDVRRILGIASLAVMPSLVEGLSLAAVETLQAGVPTVLTRTGDAAALLGAGGDLGAGAGVLPGALIDVPIPDLASMAWSDAWDAAGVDHPPHAGALATAIADVLQDLPARRAAAVRRGAQLAGELSAERMCRETAQVLFEAAGAGAVTTRFELAAARQRLADERARNDVLQATLEQVRALVVEQGRQQAEVASRIEHRVAGVADTATRTLDKLRIKQRVQSGVTSALGRVTGRTTAHPTSAAATNGATPPTTMRVDADAPGSRRRRERRWLVLAPRGTQPTAAARRSGRIALELARAGERVTVAGAGLPQGTGIAPDATVARAIELIAPGSESFTRWMDGRDESLRVVLATTHPADVDVARLARERGARVVLDATELAADLASAADALATSDDVIASSPLAPGSSAGVPARVVHVLPDDAPIAAPLIALAGAPTVAVVVLCHDNADIVPSCVESLVEHRGRVGYEIAIVDNASSDGSWEWLEERARRGDIVALRNERNGCSSGRNLGVRATRGEIVVFLDSDQRALHPAWLDPALDALREHAAIGAIAWNAGWFHPGTGGGTIVDDLPERGMSGPYAGRCFRTDVAFLATSGFAVPRSVLARTAGFDEFYDPTCFEDTDISFQIKDLGYELAYCPHIAIDHRPHATTGALREYSELFKRNEAYFLDKWRRHPEWFFDVR